MSDGRVQSIDRAAQILRCFSPRTPALGVSDIARATGLSTSTVHRLLAALAANRLVRQTADRRYALGPLLVQLARAVPATLRDAALPAMTALRDAVDETVGLHELLASDERAVVDQVESHQPLRRTYTEFGVPIPLAYGAPGKVMLSLLDEERQEAVLSRPIAAVTATTITDPDALRAELRRARERRFAFSFAERTPGIRTVAAPVFDAAGAVTGSLSVSGPEVRMPRSRLSELAPRVREAAWEVSEILGATAAAVDETLSAGGPGRGRAAARRAP
jgi:IclR family transcriptional regulator, acetate operon repressor